MSSKRAKGKTTKKRPQRATSNVFAMFDQSQIQEFKEAFNMIDQNRDGFIDKEDLHDMLASLGKQPQFLKLQMYQHMRFSVSQSHKSCFRVDSRVLVRLTVSKKNTEACTSVFSPTGKNPSDEYLEGMMSEAPGPINFTMFLTMFGERLNGTDPEDVIRNAFACFDEEGSGEACFNTNTNTT